MLAKSTLATASKPDEDAGVFPEIPFKAAFDSARTAMTMVDPHRNGSPIVWVNEAFSRLTGYSSDEAMGRSCTFLQGPDTDQGALAAIESALCSGEDLDAEFLAYRKDGSLFWNSLGISPVHDRSGHLRYCLLLQSDVSARKAAEAEVVRTKLHLEEQIDRRMADLQSALDQKTALLHEVDHRVKNNLQVISSLVLLKARRMQDADSRKVLQELAERISALAAVHRLLYSSGDVSRFDLALFVKELMTELMAPLPQGQVDLVLDVEGVSVPAAKAASLALLLNELAGNAIKHAFPEGRRGRLTIGIARTDRGLRIAVADDGIGLGGSAPTQEGLGKILIDMLVRQLKGSLSWIEREQGTRAEIVMPMDEEETQFESR